MKLANLLADMPGTRLSDPAATGLAIKGLAHDSRTVKPGYLFASLPSAARGAADRQAEFLREALQRGAAAVLSSAGQAGGGVPLLTAADPRRAYSRACAAFYGHPSRKLKLAGVTGTNGKTTTTFLLKSLFEKAGWPASVIGTVGYFIGGKSLPAPNTTPSPLDIQSLMARAVKAGSRAMAMEVSSHALDQGRVEACEFDAAIFTNLTQDHLDYHGDMRTYAKAKALLFESLGQGSKTEAAAIFNRDDPAWRFFHGRTSRRVRRLTYSLKDKKADAAAEKLVLNLKGAHFKLRLGSQRFDCSFPLTGRFNVSNALAAAAAAWALGCPGKTIVKALEKPSLPPGRLEKVDAGQPFLVLVDYAHTPDALERVLDTLKEFAPGRIITVFGCGGERDATKRPKMGKIAFDRSDLVVATSDNPRGEDPEKILDQVMAGMPDERGTVRKTLRLADRRQAIGRALKLARPADVVLLAGKGHEDYQVLKDGKVPFDDRKVAREFLKKYKRGV